LTGTVPCTRTQQHQQKDFGSDRDANFRGIRSTSFVSVYMDTLQERKQELEVILI